MGQYLCAVNNSLNVTPNIQINSSALVTGYMNEVIYSD